jgi:hypothetical protein
MINTPAEGSLETPLPVLLAASLGAAVGAPGDTCLPWTTGVRGEQPNRNRVDDHRLPAASGAALTR